MSAAPAVAHPLAPFTKAVARWRERGAEVAQQHEQIETLRRRWDRIASHTGRSHRGAFLRLHDSLVARTLDQALATIESTADDLLVGEMTSQVRRVEEAAHFDEVEALQVRWDRIAGQTGTTPRGAFVQLHDSLVSRALDGALVTLESTSDDLLMGMMASQVQQVEEKARFDVVAALQGRWDRVEEMTRAMSGSVFAVLHGALLQRALAAALAEIEAQPDPSLVRAMTAQVEHVEALAAEQAGRLSPLNDQWREIVREMQREPGYEPFEIWKGIAAAACRALEDAGGALVREIERAEGVMTTSRSVTAFCVEAGTRLREVAAERAAVDDALLLAAQRHIERVDGFESSVRELSNWQRRRQEEREHTASMAGSMNFATFAGGGAVLVGLVGFAGCVGACNRNNGMLTFGGIGQFISSLISGAVIGAAVYPIAILFLHMQGRGRSRPQFGDDLADIEAWLAQADLLERQMRAVLTDVRRIVPMGSARARVTQARTALGQDVRP